MGDPVHLEMTGDEALVLFDLLRRFDDENTLSIQDQAEERALWNLQSVLEKKLKEIFHPDYKALVMAARIRLRNSID